MPRLCKPLTLLTFLFLAPQIVAQNRIGTGAANDLYQKNCAGCHGKQMQGGSGSSLIDDVWKYGSSEKQIADVIAKGIPDMGMPGWSKALSDKQVRSLVVLINEQKAIAKKGIVAKKLKPVNGVFSAQGYKFKLEELAKADDIFWSLDFMPDGAILVSQRIGVLSLYKNGKLKTIKNTPKVWQHGQGGLLEVALHPDYKKNGWIYLSYSENKGGKEKGKTAGMTSVVRGKISRGRWVKQETIFTTDVSLHTSAGAHYGSRFVFKDGYLYFGIGDRGRMHQAQDLSRPNGKIHRIHDDGRIPKDNPFVNIKGAMPSIWSYGHRNPQGTDMDPATGLIWEAEHGPRGGDEINLIQKGKNYGWPEISYGMNYDGSPITAFTHKDDMLQPKHYWVPSIAVAGIEFYQGNVFPNWQGKLLVGGMRSEELHLLTIDKGEVVSDQIILKNQGRVRDVANGPDGNIYLLLNTRSPKSARLVKMSAVK